jgi:hypothetical protein
MKAVMILIRRLYVKLERSWEKIPQPANRRCRPTGEMSVSSSSSVAIFKTPKIIQASRVTPPPWLALGY